MATLAVFCAGMIIGIMVGYALACVEEDHDDYSPL